jgi:predicted nucleotidyltransferase
VVRSKTEVIEAIRKFGVILDKVFSRFEIRLYGSYFNGSPTADSDIDVAVVCDEFKGIDYMLSLQILNRLRLDADLYIEPISMYFDELSSPLPGSIESAVAKASEVVYRSADFDLYSAKM